MSEMLMSACYHGHNDANMLLLRGYNVYYVHNHNLARQYANMLNMLMLRGYNVYCVIQSMVHSHNLPCQHAIMVIMMLTS